MLFVPKGRGVGDGSLWAPRGELGGIFVKIPPKTSKNVSFGNSGFVGKESAGSLGWVEFLGRLFCLFLRLYARPEGKGIWGMRNAGWWMEETSFFQGRWMDSRPFDGFGY